MGPKTGKYKRTEIFHCSGQISFDPLHLKGYAGSWDT